MGQNKFSLMDLFVPKIRKNWDGFLDSNLGKDWR